MVGRAISSHHLKKLDNLRLQGKRGPRFLRGCKILQPVPLIFDGCQVVNGIESDGDCIGQVVGHSGLVVLDS